MVAWHSLLGDLGFLRVIVRLLMAGMFDGRLWELLRLHE